jgi:hypothetical protein
MALDEKKFTAGNFYDRLSTTALAPVGSRPAPNARILNPSGVRHFSIQPFEIIGIVGTVPSLLRMSGQWGSIGFLSYVRVPGSLSKLDVQAFLLVDVVALVQPYPRPNSLIIIDNANWHREVGELFERRVRERGGVVLWISPNSPDVNPIEKMWDVLTARFVSLETQALVTGRAIEYEDVHGAFRDVRMTTDALRNCGYYCNDD